VALATALAGAALGVVTLGAVSAGPADAAPAGPEYPATWTVSGNVATGTTPSGVVVTATVTGPATFAGPSGDLVFNGARPGYLPPTTKQALRLIISRCTTGPCGSITYSFSRPVLAPVFYIGDVGSGSVDAGVFTDFHDSPVTLSAGTFSLHSPGSQTSNLSIMNGGTTIAFVNPGAQVGTSGVDLASCGTFGCGVYDIHTPTLAVTHVTMNYGYAGTGNSPDEFAQVLGVTPASSALTLQKLATPSVAHTAGTMVTYSYLVTNTGNVPLTSVRPADTAFSGTGIPAAISCPSATLDPGQHMTCTGTYRLTRADVNAGKVTNTAVATGTPPSGPPVTSAPSTAMVTIPASPGIAIKKTASPGKYHKAGTLIHFMFVVSNTGNVTLTGVKVSDPRHGLSAVRCPTATLTPGQKMTCTATYVTTAADMRARSIVNTATASGSPPHAGRTVSGPSTVDVVEQTTPHVPVTGLPAGKPVPVRPTAGQEQGRPGIRLGQATGSRPVSGTPGTRPLPRR
jgi:hypothetical protein